MDQHGILTDYNSVVQMVQCCGTVHYNMSASGIAVDTWGNRLQCISVHISGISKAWELYIWVFDEMS